MSQTIYQDYIIEAVKEQTKRIRGEDPVKVYLHYENGILHSYVIEGNTALKSSYDSLVFVKTVLSTFSNSVANMSQDNFERAVRSFVDHKDIVGIPTGAYRRNC